MFFEQTTKKIKWKEIRHLYTKWYIHVWWVESFPVFNSITLNTRILNYTCMYIFYHIQIKYNLYTWMISCLTINIYLQLNKWICIIYVTIFSIPVFTVVELICKWIRIKLNDEATINVIATSLKKHCDFTLWIALWM